MGTNYFVKTRACEDACDHCEGELLHLGKFSSGWTFSFKGEPEWFDQTNKDPFQLWWDRAKSGCVETEYGVIVDTDEFLSFVLHTLSVMPTKSHAHEYPGPDTRTVGRLSFTLCEFC